MFYKNDFLDHLKTNRYSSKTIKEYGYLLESLTRYFESIGVRSVTEITESRLNEYIQLIETGRSGSKGIYIKVRRLSNYFKFLEEKEYLFLSPFRGYRIHCHVTKSVTAISQEKIEEMLSGININRPLCLKGKAMLELSYSSALRPRELYNLKIPDIDFKKGLLFLEQSKNRKDRIVPVGKEALLWVQKYITEVRTRYVKGNTNNFVFISHKTGKKLTVWGIRWAIQETLRLSGFKPIKPYALRSTASTVLLMNGMGVAYISKLLGHTEIRTTQIYLKINAKELKEVLKKKHPRMMFETIYKNHEGGKRK